MHWYILNQNSRYSCRIHRAAIHITKRVFFSLLWGLHVHSVNRNLFDLKIKRFYIRKYSLELIYFIVWMKICWNIIGEIDKEKLINHPVFGWKWFRSKVLSDFGYECKLTSDIFILFDTILESHFSINYITIHLNVNRGIFLLKYAASIGNIAWIIENSIKIRHNRIQLDAKTKGAKSHNHEYFGRSSVWFYWD